MQHPSGTVAYSHYAEACTHRIQDALQSHDPVKYFQAVCDFHPHSPSDIEDMELYLEGFALSRHRESQDDGVQPFTDPSSARFDYDALARAVIPSWLGYISKQDIVKRVSAIQEAGFNVNPAFKRMKSGELFRYFNGLRSQLSAEARQHCSQGVLEEIADQESRIHDPLLRD